MSNVIIRCCHSCSRIGHLTHKVVSAFEGDRIAQVRVVEGKYGEFTVEVDGRTVARNEGGQLPSAAEVVAAIRNKAPVGSVV